VTAAAAVAVAVLISFLCALAEGLPLSEKDMLLGIFIE
jgi:hypothetical protein